MCVSKRNRTVCKLAVKRIRKNKIKETDREDQLQSVGAVTSNKVSSFVLWL